MLSRCAQKRDAKVEKFVTKTNALNMDKTRRESLKVCDKNKCFQDAHKREM